MDEFAAAAGLLPPELAAACRALPREQRELCEEFRLRTGHRATVLLGGREFVLGSRPVEGEMLSCVLEAATRSSLHAQTEAVARGYVMGPGGVRVGLCGVGVTDRGAVTGLREVSSLAIRVPRAVPGCADGIWAELTQGGFFSTLIISPPGGGKTTLLRELVRRLSGSGCRVAVADERGEIAACANGLCGFDVGRHTDVLTGVPKGQGMEMLLRAMNPEVIAVDEITAPSDVAAMGECVGCGVRLLATVHGEEPEDLCRRRAGLQLLESGMFSRLVVIQNRGGARSYRVEEMPCV